MQSWHAGCGPGQAGTDALPEIIRLTAAAGTSLLPSGAAFESSCRDPAQRLIIQADLSRLAR
jgi:hypothetical protein